MTEYPWDIDEEFAKWFVAFTRALEASRVGRAETRDEGRADDECHDLVEVKARTDQQEDKITNVVVLAERRRPNK
jgi:hypothetical protein